jgi:hypothetical protein
MYGETRNIHRILVEKVATWKPDNKWGYNSIESFEFLYVKIHLPLKFMPFIMDIYLENINTDMLPVIAVDIHIILSPPYIVNSNIIPIMILCL